MVKVPRRGIGEFTLGDGTGWFGRRSCHILSADKSYATLGSTSSPQSAPELHAAHVFGEW